MSKFFLNGNDPQAVPTTSYWKDTAAPDAPRQAFYDAIKQRWPHMKNSGFGRWNLSIDTAPGWVENRGDGVKPTRTKRSGI